MNKTIISLVILGFCLHAQSATITTADGASFSNITTQRADPDGLYVEYQLPHGGLGMAKIKFARLSADQQKQFGYQPDKAKEFETSTINGMIEWRKENQRLEQAAKDERKASQEREQQAARAETERLLALAQLNQSEAALARAAQPEINYGGSWDGEPLAVAVPRRVFTTLPASSGRRTRK